MKGEKKEKRKQELLRIAYQMFIEKGYWETSIDEIVAEAQIAKGTYYYYFPSKEATLEEVINMMIGEEVDRARAIVSAPIPVPQKLVGVMASLRPGQREGNIAHVLNEKENIVMHEKIGWRIIDEAVPLLGQVVTEGVEQGLFACDHISERVRMIMIMSHHRFDHGQFAAGDIEVFVDMVKKSLGAQPGTPDFIREFIGYADRRNPVPAYQENHGVFADKGIRCDAGFPVRHGRESASSHGGQRHFGHLNRLVIRRWYDSAILRYEHSRERSCVLL